MGSCCKAWPKPGPLSRTGAALAGRPQRRFPPDRPVSGGFTAPYLAGWPGRPGSLPRRLRRPDPGPAGALPGRLQPTLVPASRKAGRANAGAFQRSAGRLFRYACGCRNCPGAPKDLQDNATPSGNALAAQALLKLAAFTGSEQYRARAEASLKLVSTTASQYPSAFGAWLSAADFSLAKIKQVAILGDPSDPGTRTLLTRVRESYRPNLVLAVSAFPPAPGSPALLAERPMQAGQPTAYVCEGFVCNLPVTQPEELAGQLQ